MEINKKNILSFLQGNFRYYYHKLVAAPTYLKEQYEYRLLKCANDCVKNKSCKYCGCPPLKKVFNKESCNNGDRFPDLMSATKWEEYKKKINNE